VLERGVEESLSSDYDFFAGIGVLRLPLTMFGVAQDDKLKRKLQIPRG
jgi:hypothetical protein